MQSVLLFQFLPDALASAEKVVLINPFSVLSHIDRDDMQMMPVNIFMLENQVRLVAVPHFFQILLCDVLQLGIRQYIVRVRIQGNMQHGVLGLDHRRHEGHKALHRLADVHHSGTVIVDAVGSQQPSFRLVNLLPVVGKCAVQRLAYTDFCDHFFSSSLESSTILWLSFTSSTVCFSNLKSRAIAFFSE